LSIGVPVDTPAFLVVRTRYFTAINELRTNVAKILWHDETWCNKNEEKRFVWTDGTTGVGRMQRRWGKGIHDFFCNTNDECLSTKVKDS
jgi:hypothetical protein